MGPGGAELSHAGLDTWGLAGHHPPCGPLPPGHPREPRGACGPGRSAEAGTPATPPRPQGSPSPLIHSALAVGRGEFSKDSSNEARFCSCIPRGGGKKKLCHLLVGTLVCFSCETGYRQRVNVQMSPIQRKGCDHLPPSPPPVWEEPPNPECNHLPVPVLPWAGGAGRGSGAGEGLGRRIAQVGGRALLRMADGGQRGAWTY